MMKKTIILLFFLFLFASFFLCSCTPKPESSDVGRTDTDTSTSAKGSEKEQTSSKKNEEQYSVIKIGVLEPQDAQYGENGKLELLGLMFANEENPVIELKGKKHRIELVVSENTISRKSSKEAAEKLINEGVCAVIGCSGGAYALSVAPLLEKRNIPLIDISNSPLKLTEDFSNTFTLSKSDKNCGFTAANFVFKKLKKESAYIIALLGDDSSDESAFFFSQKAKALGKKTRFRHFDPEQNDFSSFAAEAAAFDSVFICAPLSYSRSMINAFSQSGVDTVITTGAWNSEKLFHELSENSLDLYMVSNLGYDEQSDRCRAFMNWMGSDADLSEMSGGSIESGIAYGGVDAYDVLYEAISVADSAVPSAIVKRLSKLKTKGISGSISFSANGERTQKSVVYLFDRRANLLDKQ